MPFAEGKWDGRKVAILQPVYNGIEPCAHHSLFWAYAKYGPEKVALLQPREMTTIWRARNILADKFLASGIEYAIFVDSDMVFPCGDAAMMEGYGGYSLRGVKREAYSSNFIGRLMAHGPEYGIVGALYYQRKHGGKACCASAFESDAANEALLGKIGTGLQHENWVGTGCMRVARWVFEKMKEAASEKWPDIVSEAEYGLFNPISARAGEDVSFCIRAQQIGIKSHLDTSLVCLHKGDYYFGPTSP